MGLPGILHFGQESVDQTLVPTLSNPVGRGPAHSFSQSVPALWAPLPRAVRKGHDPGQTSSAPSSNRPSVAAGRAKPSLEPTASPAPGPGAASSLTRSRGTPGPWGRLSRDWLGKSFPESAVSGGRLDPQGAGPSGC